MGETPRRIQVAEAVAASMSAAGMTVEDLAIRAGIPLAYLRAHLEGFVAFDVDELEVVANALGTKAVQFFDP